MPSSTKTRTPTKKKTTVSRASTPASTPRKHKLKPKLESSPSSRAKCKECGKKIEKATNRYGIPRFADTGRGFEAESYGYYHEACCPAELKKEAVAAAENTDPEEASNEKILKERRELGNNLKKLRVVFAEELGVEEHYKIFQNKTIDDLVLKMPIKTSELLGIYGIKEKRRKNFGDPILTIIRQYKRKMGLMRGNTLQSTANKASKSKKKKPAEAANEERDDVDIFIGETFTCEELVAQKFKHAAENGYVISIDD